ncbi:hypothetical protein ACQ4PT_031994 [Festuca glaucescens]
MARRQQQQQERRGGVALLSFSLFSARSAGGGNRGAACSGYEGEEAGAPPLLRQRVSRLGRAAESSCSLPPPPLWFAEERKRESERWAARQIEMGRAEGGSCCDSPSLAHHAARFEGRGLSSIGTPSEVVSVTTGVLNPLIGKLTKLLGGEYNNKLTGVMREQASSLKDELSAIKPLLDKMELTDDLDASARNWRDRVRETSYDMENCIDEFMHNTDGATDAEASFVEKMASRIEELKVLAVEANARRREMCKHDDDAINNSTHAHVVADSPISAIRKEVAVLVGIDGPREELVVLLTDPQIELKVVSIVGSAGSGKTTLAMQVYDEIEAQFDCTTFVSASRRPDVESLLGRLLLNLGMTEFSRTLELHEIIDCLREHLEHKRYFILVDDLWDQSAWNIMRCAFPENSNGSRMIVTTRLDDVAVNACHNDHACIYRMKHLEEQDSRNLFFNRVFGSNNVCPPQFQYISAEIFKKCGGLPLAIVTIAGLLASTEARSLNEWESIKKALGAMSATKPTLEEMRGILNLSYMHLPVYLRPCLLYLGMYPEDREIWRDDLVKQWIGEGFICSMPGVDLYDVAESYFNDLINRSLIQPERTEYGEVLSCRLHGMMLDLILSKCIEDNFISVAYNYDDVERLNSFKHKIRRLSLKSCAESETLSTSMSQVRSCALFGVLRYTPPLSDFKYLQMLLFDFPFGWDATVDLTAIAHLFLLRYLKVLALTAGIALPTEIKGLVHLETLELDCHRTQSFPSDITHLVNLFHLILPDGTMLPKGIQNMKLVRTLHCSGMSEGSLEDIKGLSELTNLKELELSTPYGQCLTVEGVDTLISSIGLVRDLKHLMLDCDSECDGYERLSDSLSDPPPCLEYLDLETWKLSRVPRWIGELSCLRFLHLFVLHLSSDEVCVLGELPSLISAMLHVSEVSKNKVVVGAGLFPLLEVFWFQSNEDVSTYLSFEAGAMPKLQKLKLGFGWQEWRGATPVGMECLPCLRDIRVWLRYTVLQSSKNEKDVRADVESAFKCAVRRYPKHTSVVVD